MRFLLSFLLLSSFLFTPTLVLAQDATPSSFIAPTPAQSNYTLPYPGILPDNPFYRLKMIRDGIVLFLITDSYKKAQFQLLQADKRLQAGVALIEKDKQTVPLAISTISKGENYFSQAIQTTVHVQSGGRDIGALLGDLQQSSRKHVEVLTNLKKEVPQQSTAFDSFLRQVKSFQQQLKLLEKH